MREASFRGFFVVFAKISRGVEEFLREDGGFQLNLGGSIHDRLAVDATKVVDALLREIEGTASRLEAGVAAFEECTHVGRNERVGEAFEGKLAFLVLEIKRGGGIEIDDF